MSNDDYAKGFKDGILFEIDMLLQAQKHNTAGTMDPETFKEGLEGQRQSIADIDPQMVMSVSLIAPTVLDALMKQMEEGE